VASGAEATVALRPLTRADFPALVAWINAPHVQRWWRQPMSVEAAEAEYGAALDGEDPTEHFVVEVDGRPVGMIQRCRVGDHPEYVEALSPTGTPAPAAAIDYLIGEVGWTGRGVGPRMIALAVRDAFARYPEVVAIVVLVQQDNRPSWRALEHAGFERAWSGQIVSDDPSDEGPSHVYVLHR
jgi:aminoglycoside 6'-N-acetyltransferase